MPGFFSLPPMDRDEPRFAVASRQMLESGDYVAIRFQEEARNKKPVGIYWLQAGAVAIGERLGVSDARYQIWLYRVPSLLGSILSVLLTYWAALAFVPRAAAFTAAALFASTLLLNAEAHLAKTDAVLTSTVIAAMGVLARLWRDRDKQGAGPELALLFWSALAAGILVKGPITPMISGAAVVVLSWRIKSGQWLRPLRPLLGVLWCLLLVAPWLIMIAIQTKGAFFTEAIGNDMLGKIASAKEAHGAPPLTYAAIFWITGWPLAPFAALALPYIWQNWRQERIFFLLAWLVPAWLLFELVPTKLPHYVLPLYPAIALLVGIALHQQALGFASGWRRWAVILLPLIPILLIVIAVVLVSRMGLIIGVDFYLAACVLLAGCIYGRYLIRDQPPPSLDVLVLWAPVLSFLSMIMVYSTLLTTAAFAPFVLSPRMAALRDQLQTPDCPKLSVASGSTHEPSLVFLVGSNIVLTNAAGAAAFLSGGSCRLVFINMNDRGAFLEALTDWPKQAHLRLAQKIEGINLNGGKELEIVALVRGKD